MSLTPDITPEQIDDWFRIGKKSIKIQGIPKSTTKGRIYDPTTRQPRVEQARHVPHYKSHPEYHGGHDYANHYVQEEKERLMNRVAWAASETTSALSSRLDALEIDSTIAGTDTTIPAEFVPPNSTDVYNNYSFTRKYDDKLPIFDFRDQVTSTIESNQVTVIQGATGSGKTTQVAQYILDHYAQQNKYCNIVVTQPRRIAAISIARRVCSERDWEMGTLCGYQVGLDKTASEDTRILYCTTGILLNKLINEKNMNQYTHVILDEVHERDQETDFCLLVVKRLLRTNSRHTRVVLMSATFDSDMFAQYFSLPVMDKLEQAPVVNVEGRPYKVLQFYAEDLMQLGDLPMLDENNPCISDEATTLAVKLIEQFDSLEQKEQGLNPSGFAPIRGTVLVFLPGLAEITNLIEELTKLSVKHRLKLIPLHSSITTEEQAMVFHSPEAGCRKVILSTNIAESSITVPDIKYVIDFCLTKNLTCDFETNYTSLQVNWASKANCRQREGRAGRVSNGRVYRLITKHFYETSIPDYGIPEMQRSPLDKLILHVKVLDIGEPKAILAHALSPPNIDDIERNILLLKELGALVDLDGIPNRHDGQLTFIGRVLADLPVDCKIGKLIMLGHVFGLLEESLVIAAAMSLKSIFAKPFKQGLEAYRNKLAWSSGSLSDSLAILQAYQTWQSKLNRGEFKRRGGGGEVGWGKQRYLQIRRLKEVSLLVQDLEKRLVKFNILKPRYEPQYMSEMSQDQHNLLLKIVLCGAFYPNYFVRGDIDEMDSIKQLSGKDPLNTVMVKGLPANQGPLYKEPIEDLFRKCEANPKAYFEETKAYIEFPWKPYMRSKVHQGVYMALKMKQLRMPLFVDLYSDEEAFNIMQRLNTAKSEATTQGQLRSNRLTGTNQMAPEVGGRQIGVHVSPPDPSKVVCKICVTEVIECSHFWAQYREPENYQDLTQVQNTLNRDRGHMLKPISGRARVGQFCAAPFQDVESVEYYRAKVQSVENRFEENMRSHREHVEVFFVDYGNVSVMPADQLREMPPQLLQIPFQAFECKLIKIRPSPLKCPDGKWTPQATEAFKQMVLFQEVVARPYSVVHGIVRMELIYVTPEGRQFYINEKLKDLQFADESQESGLSEQSHTLRQAEYFTQASANTHASNTTQEDRSELRTTGWTPVHLGTEGARSRHPGGKVNLNGPSNPNEMSFYNLTNIGRLRAAKIDQDSVNCISIDDEPHDPHQRLMVAGFVGLNPNGSAMVARDTTILPLIPGLAAIVVLLFTPKAEFRTDSQKSKYIGALCGLGWDDETGFPLLPDHDVEIPFDVEFKTADITAINAVRLAINMAIGSQSVIASWSENAVYKIQKNARNRLMDLIQQRRESCPVESPKYMYQWNQIDKDDILDPQVEGYDNQVIFRLHSGVSLQGEDLSPSEANQQEEHGRRHVMALREIVRRNEKRSPTVCELCHVTCPTNQLLALHLETQNHKRQEERLLSET